MTEHGPDWRTIAGQAQADQIAAAVQPFALSVTAFYRTLRRQGLPRELAAGLTAHWMTVAMHLAAEREG